MFLLNEIEISSINLNIFTVEAKRLKCTKLLSTCPEYQVCSAQDKCFGNTTIFWGNNEGQCCCEENGIEIKRNDMQKFTTFKKFQF